MPKLVCNCGYIHNLSNIPDDGYIVIKDKEYEGLVELEVISYQAKDQNSEEQSPEWNERNIREAKIINMQTRLYECPECNGVIWIRTDGKSYYYSKERTFE